MITQSNKMQPITGRIEANTMFSARKVEDGSTWSQTTFKLVSSVFIQMIYVVLLLSNLTVESHTKLFEAPWIDCRLRGRRWRGEEK